MAEETWKLVKGGKGEGGSEWMALVSFRAVLSGYEGLMEVSSQLRAVAMSLSLW